MQATPTQRAVIHSRGCELAVAAGAGSGKTSTLIQRIIGLVAGLTPDGAALTSKAVDITSLLVVTFTRAAAAELRERVDAALEAELATREQELIKLPQPLRGEKLELIHHLRRQRALLPMAQISTIHSFCQRMINQYGAADGLSAESLLGEEDAAQIKHQLATRFLDRQLGKADDPALRALALAWGGRDGVGPSQLSSGQGNSGLRALLLRLHEFQQGLLDPRDWWMRRMAVPALDPECCDSKHAIVAGLLEGFARWRDETITTSQRESQLISGWLPDTPYVDYINWRLELLEGISTAATWDDLAEGLARTFMNCDGSGGNPQFKQKKNAWFCYRYDIPKDSPWYEALSASCKQMRDQASEWHGLFSEPWQEVARRENAVNAWLERLWRLGLEFNEEYLEVKQQRQAVDFNDLERGALSLLLAGIADETAVTDHQDGARLLPSQLALELRGTFREVLVDEYQDVNRLQDAILRLVTPELPDGSQSRVVVGDIKQSIYGFRQAEPEIFRALVNRLEKDSAQGRSSSTHRLRENFRSHPEVLAAVNAVMSGLFTEALGGENYSSSGSLEYGGSYGVPSAQNQAPERLRLHLVLEAVGEPSPDSTDDSPADAADDADRTAPGTDEKAYHHLAARVRQVYAEGQEPRGFLAERGSGEQRPVRWEDMVVLLRSRTGLGILRIILEQAGIPAQVPSSGSFFDQPDVVDALMLLRATANPYDDMALAAVLRGPLGRLSCEELLIALHGGASTPGKHAPVLERVRALLESPAIDLPFASEDIERLNWRLTGMLSQLEAWRSFAVRESVSTVVWRVLSEASLLIAAAAAPYGAQRTANLFELHDRALEFDALGRFGLPRFLEYLDAVKASARDTGEFPAATGSGAVRIMTVHQAKGLEFPCVFLPYIHRKFNQLDLRQQVLLSYRYGLAGQHLDLEAPLAALAAGQQPVMPVRKPSIAFRRVKRGLEQQLAAEELRLLYVAMTRAQERLELFAVLNPADVETARSQHLIEPGQAKRPWDWIRRQLRDGVNAALSSTTAETVQGAGGWLINAVAAPETAEAGEAERRQWGRPGTEQAELESLNADDFAKLTHRLRYEYPWRGSAALPVKATITGLSHHAEPQGVSSDERVRHARTQDRAAALPRFMVRSEKESPLQHGTEVHGLLAQLDVTRGLDAAEIAKIWDGNEGHAIAEQYAQAAARMLHELQHAFGPWEGMAQAHELPVSVRVPARSLRGLLDERLIEPATCAPEDWVLVQGVLDVLLLWPERAVVIDYKTDRGLDSEGLKTRYSEQLKLYAHAVSELWPNLSAESITCVIYALNGPGLVIL